MKLSRILLELLDDQEGKKAYSISDPKIVKSLPTKNTVKYFFQNTNKTKYEVVFDSNFFPKADKHKWETDVSFDAIRKKDKYASLYMPSDNDNDKYSETGERDAIAVFYTVAEAIKRFIDEFKPELLMYTGGLSSKEIGIYSDPSSGKAGDTARDRIYDRMVEKMIQQIPDYGFERKGFQMEIFYKGELPVPGHHKIFNYPVKK